MFTPFLSFFFQFFSKERKNDVNEKCGDSLLKHEKGNQMFGYLFEPENYRTRRMFEHGAGTNHQTGSKYGRGTSIFDLAER